MARCWGLIVHNAGGRSEYVKVVAEDYSKRDAWFSTQTDAAEAARIIQRMRNDSAFEGVSVYKIAPRKPRLTVETAFALDEPLDDMLEDLLD